MAHLIVLLSLFGCPGSSDVATVGVPTPRPLVCGTSSDLLEAPGSIESPLGPLSAIDLLDVTAFAQLTHDTVFIEADARFLVGDQGGRPTFELGPASTVTLDGAAIELERAVVSDPLREVVVLPELEPCSEHTLTVSHELDETWMQGAGGQTRLQPLEAGTYWAAGLEDDAPGKFLGMWMPSNLLFDRFDLEITFDVSALPEPHQLVSTGAPESDPWTRQWFGIQAHTPFWVISPVAETVSLHHPVVLIDQTIELEIYALASDNGADLPQARDRAEAALQAFDVDFGAYHHGERYLLWIRNDQNSSMEYDGATLTAMGAIEHEILHSWFARGASPVADLHGWVDEAMTSWVTDLFPYRAVALDYQSDPMHLQVGEDEWAGPELSYRQYVFGSSIFSDVAFNHSVAQVQEAMGTFYLEHAGASYRATDVERHLTCWFDDDRVRQAFHHRAFGGTEPGSRPAEWCR